MTTLEALVQIEPAATAGNPVDFSYDVGTWRGVFELADPSAGAGVEWHDVSDYFLGYNYQRGATVYGGRYEASVANIELMADGNTLAPYNSDTSATFGVHVDLGAGLLVRFSLIRVVAGAVVEWIPRFTLKVEYWGDASHARGAIRRHLIVARDTLTSLVNVPVAAAVEHDWSDRLVHVVTSSAWAYGMVAYHDHSLTLPARDEQAAAQAELDATLDPVGLAWFTDRTGRLWVIPKPGDTLHTGALTLPTIHFHYLADTTTAGIVSYAVDSDAAEPFGLPKTEDAVRNRVIVSVSGSVVYDNDDPTSVQRFDPKVHSVAWQAQSDQAALDFLNYRAWAQVEATPFVTTSDMPGFYDLLLADYLWPTNVDHRAGASEPGVLATGHVRGFREDVRTCGSLLEMTIRTTVDIQTLSDVQSMLPVEDLALSDVIDVAAEWTWTNPGGQPITPTHTQVRLLGLSSLWVTIAYPTTVYSWGTLTPDTEYTYQVRLVEYTGGLITAFSPTRQVVFTTLSADDMPGTGGPGGDVDVPIGGCLSTAWQLEQFNPDGTSGWEVIASGTTASTPVDVSAYVEPGGVYRMRTNRCSEGWVTGPSWVEPDDWGDPCTTPTALAGAPFDADLIAYVPKVCSPFTIREAVSDNVAAIGPAFGAITALGSTPVLFASSEGTVAYGNGSSALNALVTDASLSVKVKLGDQPAGSVKLADFAGMSIAVSADGAGFGVAGSILEDTGPGSTVVTVAGGTELDLDTWYNVALVHDVTAETLKLYVDGAVEASALSGVTARTNAVTAAWSIELPENGYITDVAVWDRVLDDTELPGYVPTAFDATDWSNCRWWYKPDDPAARTMVGASPSQLLDQSGNGITATVNSVPAMGSINGVVALPIVAGDSFGSSYLANPYAVTARAITMAAVFQITAVSAASQGLLFTVSGTLADLYGLFLEPRAAKLCVGYGGNHTGGASEYRRYDTTTNVLAAGGKYVAVCTMDQTGPPRLWLNGVEQTLADADGFLAASGFLASTGANHNHQAGQRTGGAWQFTGAYGDTALWSDRKGPTDCVAISNSLMDKWGI